jgi:Zn-finger nucleic acid-binding protein
MDVSTDLKCPKCLAPMRAIERSGIVVDRCTECGGIFLDRGELERLMRAENEYTEREFVTRERERGYPVEPRGDFRAPQYRRDDDDDDRYKREYREYPPHQGRPYKKKRKNFLEDLFDFG